MTHRTTSWNTPYTFSGKEKDVETGYSYFGARYYDSDLSIWLSVDPMSDKYPSMSPYNYCANNPVILVDPDGRIIVSVNKTTNKYINTYLNEQFGERNPFKVRSNGVITFNLRKYNQYISQCNPEQRIMAEGLFHAINRPETCYVNIKKDNSKGNVFFYPLGYIFNETTQMSELADAYKITSEEAALCIKNDDIANTYFIAMYDNLCKTETYTTGQIQNNQEILTGCSASSDFIHELLDEFYNYYTTHNVDSSSAERDQVQYQNAALRNIGKLERNRHNETR